MSEFTEAEVAHMAGRRTADDLTAHLLKTMSEQIKALTSQNDDIKATLHAIQLAMLTQQGHSDSKVENFEVRVTSLESWRDAMTKQMVAIVILVLVAIFFAVAKGAGLRLG